MADNVTLPGTGAVVATDEVSSRHFQITKVAYGADGTATQVATDAALPTGAGSVMLSGTAVAYDTDVIASTDASGYQMISFMLTGTFVGAVSLHGSNDGTNWGQLPTQPVDGQTDPADGSGRQSPGILYVGVVPTRYVRLRCTYYSSGTIGATARLYNGAHAGLTPYYSYVRASSGSSPFDADSGTAWSGARSYGHGYNGASWDRARLAKIFKSVSATASGDTAVWTPASGKKFQLLKFQLFLTAQAAQSSAGTITVKLRDATTTTGIEIPVYVPGTGGTALGGWNSGWIDVGPYGYRSSTNNNVLNVNLSAALTAGHLGVLAIGTEE